MQLSVDRTEEEVNELLAQPAFSLISTDEQLEALSAQHSGRNFRYDFRGFTPAQVIEVAKNTNIPFGNWRLVLDVRRGMQMLGYPSFM